MIFPLERRRTFYAYISYWWHLEQTCTTLFKRAQNTQPPTQDSRHITRPKGTYSCETKDPLDPHRSHFPQFSASIYVKLQYLVNYHISSQQKCLFLSTSYISMPIEDGPTALPRAYRTRKTDSPCRGAGRTCRSPLRDGRPRVPVAPVPLHHLQVAHAFYDARGLLESVLRLGSAKQPQSTTKSTAVKRSLKRGAVRCIPFSVGGPSLRARARPLLQSLLVMPTCCLFF